MGGKNKISVRCQELAGDAQITDEYQGLSLRYKTEDADLGVNNLLVI